MIVDPIVGSVFSLLRFLLFSFYSMSRKKYPMKNMISSVRRVL